MPITVKGIQYSYQIDFFNQVPTHVKSQVHDLPVLSVPQATPIDRNRSNDVYLPQNDNRFSFAGPRAAPQVSIAASPDPQPLNAAPASLSADSSSLTESSPRFNSAVSEPAQIARKIPGENANLRFATPLAAQTERDNPLMPAELPAPLSSVPPTDIASPVDEVKAIPRFEFNRAMRAYKPDAGSFLQPGGYEKSEFGRAEFFAEPPQSVMAPPVLPENSSQIDLSPLREGELKVEAAVLARDPEISSGEALLSEDRQNPVESAITPPERATRPQGENFMARQAFRLYEIFAAPTLLASGNFVDVRS